MTSQYNDGSANAPAGSPLLPSLLADYAVRPPWEVAGVDYAVGVPTGTTLKDPSTISMAGVSVNTTNHTATIAGNNVTLSGYNFGLANGWEVIVQGANDSIQNSVFVVGPNQGSNGTVLNVTASASNFSLLDNEINGNNVAVTPQVGSTVSIASSGTLTFQYNYFHNSGGDMIDFGGNSSTEVDVVQYNLFANVGVNTAYADTMQWYGSPIGAGSDIGFNTVYQNVNQPGPGMGALVPGPGGSNSTVTGLTVNNDTIIQTANDTNGNFTMGFEADPGVAASNVVIHDLYVDPTGALGYTGSPWFPTGYYGDNLGQSTVMSNVIDMVTGAPVPVPSVSNKTSQGYYVYPDASGNSPVLSDVYSVTASQKSGTLTPGITISFTVKLDETFTVTGTPTLALNDGGTATYSGGSGSNALTFSYTVATTDKAVSALAITGVNLPSGATVKDAVGNTANLAGAVRTFLELGVNPGSSSPSPVTVADSALTEENQAVSIAVLANDTGGGGTLNPASVTVSVAAGHGSTAVNASTGAITYTPAAGYFGNDTFHYTVADTDGVVSAPATITVTVDAPPVAVADSAVTEENQAVSIAVLGNDTDPVGTINPASVAVSSAPGHGTTSVNASTGAITYTPANGFYGTDTFQYTVANTLGAASAPATVSVTVDAPPVAVADSAVTEENQAVSVAVLGNDTDPVGTINPASVAVSSAPGHGTTSVNASTGAITYTPANGFYGTYTFQYTVANTLGAASAPAVVTVTVDAPPVAAADSAVTKENQAVIVAVLANDTDPVGTINPASVTVSTAAAHGTTAVNASTGAITYTPANGFYGTDTFQYTVANTLGAASAPATVSVSVTVDAPPTVVWSPASASGVEGSAIPLGTISDMVNGLSLVSLTVSAIPVGATLGDGTHSFTAAAGSTSVNVAGWTLSSLRITPTNDANFTLSITAVVQDAEGNTSSASASEAVTVNPLAPAVAWSPASASGVEGSPIALGAISDTVNSLAGDGNSLVSLTVGAIPVGATLSDGTHSFTAAAGSTSVNVAGWTLSSLQITPTSDANFTLSITAVVQDAEGNTSSASASEAVTVNPLAPAVAWSPASASGVEGSPIALGAISDTVNSLAGDSNSLQSLIVSAIQISAILSDGTHSFTAAAGNTSVNVAGWNLSSLRVTPANDANFTLAVAAAAQDAEGNTSSASASEAVTVSPLAPTVSWSPAAASGVAGSAILLGTIIDTINSLSGDGNILQSLIVSAIPVGTTLSDGTHSFTAAAGSTSVSVAAWSLSTLTLSAAVAMTAVLGVTATVQDAQGNTSSAAASEAVTVNSASSGYPDGSANASAGTPQLPTLLSGYPVRPPWKVAGVDYHVGVPTGMTLKTPTAANMPAGASLSGQTIRVTGNNVTISGFDFSGNGGYAIYINPGASGTSITDNYFAYSSPTAPAPPIFISSGASNTYIAYNTINGGGANGPTSYVQLISNSGSGLTVEYNYMYDAPGRFVSTGGGPLVYEFNLLENGGWTAGVHLNFLQNSTGAMVNPIVDFNTLVQARTLSPGEGFQMETALTNNSITGADLSYNTMISQATALQPGAANPAISYFIHAGSNSNFPGPATGTASNNYIDTTSAYGAIYPGTDRIHIF